ncbi:MAG TPA: hypothetical protein VMN82_16265 [Thermoanaerobaculia bacterium]|nr:hypothetical protein [Thermoanaerobaculia bacterium]
MRFRAGIAATLLVAVACVCQAQTGPRMYRIHLNPSGTMVSLDQPVLMNGKYVFHAWPDGEQTALRQALVSKIDPLTGPTQGTVYQLDLNPSGTLLARDVPTLKGSAYVFHAWRGAELMSLRQSDVRKITPLTGDAAFWAIERANGEKSIGGTLSMQGTSSVVAIGTPPGQNTSQAGRSGLSSVSGAPSNGNWTYQGTPGVSDAWSPANATMSNGVPTMPGATNGTAPPTQPQ